MPSTPSTTRSISSRGYPSVSKGRVHAAQVAARHRAQQARALETRISGHLDPSFVRERVRHPRIAAIGAVLDDDEAAARLQHLADAGKDRSLVAYEMQGVGHDDSVERTQRNRAREVRDDDLELRPWKPLPHLGGEPAHRTGVAVDRGYVRAWSQQVCERQGESALTRSEVRPSPALGNDSVAQEADQLSVIHDSARPAPAPSAPPFRGIPSTRLTRPVASRRW